MGFRYAGKNSVPPFARAAQAIRTPWKRSPDLASARL